MEGIYETNEKFDFNKLVLLSPVNTTGGGYFIKFRINDSPLYIQPPKCKTKQGILKSNKKYYCDLMFTNENESFINWMERLENHCRKVIFENRDKWFDIELDEHDIENSFTSPLKLFKSGKYYISRTNVPSTMGICSLKIYNEDEEEIQEIHENSDVMTILEIQGIKCSTKNFQIELEIKQMMVIESKNLFEKCIFKGKTSGGGGGGEIIRKPLEETLSSTTPEFSASDTSATPDSETPLRLQTISSPLSTSETLSSATPEFVEDAESNMKEFSVSTPPHLQNPIKEIDLPNENQESEISEFIFDLDKVNQTDVVKIKKRNEIYFELYREAKRKAKIARDLALSSYLEAKHIKNTYLLEDFHDDSDSDFDEESFESEINKNK